MRASKKLAPLTLVKFGGSLITEKSGNRSARSDVISRLASELAEASQTDPRAILLGHGSGSFGHPAAEAAGIVDGLKPARSLGGVSRTQSAARELHHLVINALEAHGLSPFSLPPSAWMVADDGLLRVLTLDPLERALDLGLMPVVCGDVLLDRQKGVTIASTEAVLLALARALSRHPERAIREALWLGNTPGVLDETGQLIPVLTDQNWDPAAVRESATTDVTGGIRLRVDTTRALASLGIPSLITDGRQPGLLRSVLRGTDRPGTQVLTTPASGTSLPPS